MRHIAIILVLLLCAETNAGAASRQAAVNKAIEQTRSRLSPAAQPQRVPQRANSSPGKMESLDVERLNRLIRALDRTWVLPKAGAKDPVGSNFQYKKTCASIYKARHGACQQLGFGVMCFNYCHERGEKLAFKCQDASDASYCKQSGTFDTFLAKYRKDGYKAKAYIHQMISRCYSTTICNTQTGILNSTIIDEDFEPVEKTTKVNRLKLLTRKPGSPLALMKLKTKVTTTTTEFPEVEEVDEDEMEATTTTRKAKIVKKKPSGSLTLKTKPTPAPENIPTTTKANIWDKFTIGNKAKPTPKYIPFWQRLMSTTLKPTEDEADVEEEAELEEVTSTQAEEPSTTLTTTTTTIVTTNEPSTTMEIEEETTEEAMEPIKVVQKSNPEKHTFKPLPVTVPQPFGPELAHQKPNEDVAAGPGFWNRFQPNRWFESIHYVTNTGK
ncbi:unnamed protein product [Caenorhabditis bovis]|uniref:Uncharacterized protein n=1 Tax=Caenorhabditis bovis TaxID=2654633 RepID=A0A8S1EAL9_9PELO|nr:unnamed protein product [Caenorhabditis bovis]